MALSQKELLNPCLTAQTPNLHDVALPQWTQLPTLTEFEEAMRNTKTQRACFDDHVPGDILHFGAGTFAWTLYPLLLKLWITSCEPILYKGGQLIAAYKGKGDASRCESYRSLLISSTIGKLFHRLFRHGLMKEFLPNALNMQLGGMPRISVTQGSHILHGFHHHFVCQGESVAILFVDIQNAFYRLLRQHLRPSKSDPRSVHELFTKMGLPDAAYKEFEYMMSTASALEEGGASHHVQHLAREFLNSTWFLVPGSDQYTIARKGSRPGDSFADLLFSVAFRHLLRQVQHTVKQYGVDLEVCWSGKREPVATCAKKQTVQALGPVWADDLAVLLHCGDPHQLVEQVRYCAGTLFDVLQLAGMTPNMKQSKTEVVLDLRGARSVAVRRELDGMDYAISTTSRWMDSTLRVVGSYKHLGTWIEVKCRHAKDLRCKFGQAHTTFGKYRAAIFGNKGMRLTTKVRLFDTLVMVAAMYNASSWMPLHTTDAKLLHSGVMRLYKRLALNHFGLDSRQWKDEKIRGELGVVAPPIHLSISRLRYLQHLIRSGDTTVWAILQQNFAWWGLVDNDISWLRLQVRTTLPDCGIEDSWQEWWSYLYPSGRRWNKLLRRAMVHSILQERKVAGWFQWHREACAIFAEHGLFVQPTTTSSVLDEHFCLACRKVFRTCAAWSVHAFKIHGRTTRVRDVASGTQCQVCLKHYKNHTSLINHLKYSTNCYEQLVERMHWVEATQPAMNSRADRVSSDVLPPPPLQAEGPRVELKPVTQQQLDGERQRLLDAWEEIRRDPLYTDSYVWFRRISDRLRRASLQTTLSAVELRMLMAEWRGSLLAAGMTTEHYGFDRGIQHFQEVFSAQWFLETDQPEEQIKDPMQMIDEWLRQKPRWVPVPRPIRFRQILVAHLYSGRRREGDIQSFAEQHWLHTSGRMRVLSVDIIFSETWGNLMRQQTREVFLHAAMQGILTAVVAGPPCETWSIARRKGLYEMSGPVPVRDVHNLEGFPCLSIREAKQVCTGNDLLGVVAILIAAQYVAGNFLLCEHPQEPFRYAEAPSIWKIPYMLLCLGLKGIQKLEIMQGHFGAWSAKPTTLCVVHGPTNSQDILYRNRLRHDLPKGASIGKGKDGVYRTSGLKEYPKHLCCAIWMMIEHHLAQRGFEVCLEETDSTLLERMSTLEAGLDHSAEHMGPDYHPCQ